jgi:hypothetical protein
MMSNKQYIFAIIAFTVFFMGILAIFNAVIDPYGLTRLYKKAGFNENKTEIFYQLSVTKPYHYLLNNTESLVIGSSRAGSSIDPDHPALINDNYYNYATPGARPEQDYQKLLSAVALGRVNKLIYFVDFFTFNRSGNLPDEVIESFRKRVSSEHSIFTDKEFLNQFLLDVGADLWAYHTLRDSVRTIDKQYAADNGNLTYLLLKDNGHWTMHYSNEHRLLANFVAVEKSYLRSNWFPADTRYFSLNHEDNGISSPFLYFEKILLLAHENDIETTLVILPVHARLLDNLDYAGLWENFEYWKTQLVVINESIASSNKSTAFTTWDFNGYYPPLTEVVTKQTAFNSLNWMYDSAHLSKDLGDSIIDIITGKKEPYFGGKISMQNIDSWLKDQRILREQYRQKNPLLTEGIRQQVGQLKDKFPWVVSPPKN